MAKIQVVKESGERLPFLRGILVQSLVGAGLSFQDAYASAQAVRGSLAEEGGEITSAQLRARVAGYLEKRFGAASRRAYEAQTEDQQPVIVQANGGESRYSEGVLTRCLEACAIGKQQALETARRVREVLRERGERRIEHLELRRLVHRTLQEQGAPEAAQRYLSWRQFEASGEPLILLVGGTTGAGKSTVTAELAYRLNVVRTQSTDMMREIIRCYLAPHVVPTLAYSSFEAWRGIPALEPTATHTGAENPLIAGFLSQFGNVKVALEATITRSIQERQSLIVDGVHVLPTRLDLGDVARKAVIVPIMLAVTTRQRLAQQLKRRSREQPDRAASRYLQQLDAIWDLQSYLLGLADKGGIPIVGNWTVESTVREILDEVSRRVGERFPADPSTLG